MYICSYVSDKSAFFFLDDDPTSTPLTSLRIKVRQQSLPIDNDEEGMRHTYIIYDVHERKKLSVVYMHVHM